MLNNYSSLTTKKEIEIFKQEKDDKKGNNIS